MTQAVILTIEQQKRIVTAAKRQGWEEGRADVLKMIDLEVTDIRRAIHMLINPYGEPS